MKNLNKFVALKTGRRNIKLRISRTDSGNFYAKFPVSKKELKSVQSQKTSNRG